MFNWLVRVMLLVMMIWWVGLSKGGICWMIFVVRWCVVMGLF